MNENYAILLTFRTGENNDFSVHPELLKDGKPIEEWKRKSIRVLPDLQQKYDCWKEHYIQQANQPHDKRIILPPATIHASSLKNFQNAADELKASLHQWFNSPQLEALKESIVNRIRGLSDPSVPIFFKFNTFSQEQNTFLRRLPWSCWDLFDELPNADAALGFAYTDSVKPSLRNLKILAVFGSDEGGINLEADRRFVSQLKQFGARVRDLSCPKPETLYSTLRHNAYDVLFFAGHSLSTDGQRNGELLLQPQRPVSMKRFLSSLQTAARRGLKLAIFNSCDGLGLADLLTQRARIPSVVVFREPVPDEVARRFLQYFLQEFSNGTPLFRAVREARNQLQFLEDRPENPLPCASWLPVVCQNPSQSELVWDKTARKRLWKIGAAAIILALLTAVTPQLLKIILPSPDVLLSRGDTLVMTSETNNAKEKGLAAYADGNWDEAIAAFRKSLNQELRENEISEVKDSLDPETWIYLNNAIAQKNTASDPSKKMMELAIAVPANAEKADGRPGEEQFMSQELLRGAALRQAEFNCGVEELMAAVRDLDSPLNCKPESDKKWIHLTIADEMPGESTSEQVAVALSEMSEPILGVIGHFGSDSCKQAGEVYARNQIVMVSPTCTSTGLSNFNDYVFRTVPNDAVAAERLAQVVSGWNADVAIAYTHDSDYPESYKNAFESQLPSGEYIHICGDLGDNFSYPNCVKEATAKGADFILMVPTAIETINAALNMLDDLNGMIPLGSDSVFNAVTVDENYGAKAAAAGLRIYVPWHPSSNPENRTPFERNATQFFDVDEANYTWYWRAQSAYDALSAFAQGIIDIGDNPSGSRLMQRFRSYDFAADGVVGEDSVKFLDSGDRDRSGFEDKIGAIVGVAGYPNSTGGIKYDFVRVDE